MPLVRISLLEGRPAEYKKTVGDTIHQAMVDTISCPPQDRFQVITEHSKENFLCTPEYLGIPHTDALIIVQITLNEGRTLDLKKALYRAIANGLGTAVGVSTQDVIISLVEVRKENWSFGNGVAQYAS
jgi:phenylpyruvate tautomerase PptA (4-oxalocrotonate tautomerase family)